MLKETKFFQKTWFLMRTYLAHFPFTN